MGRSDTFFRMFGNTSGYGGSSATVDGNDFQLLALSAGSTTAPGDAAYYDPRFNYDGSGDTGFQYFVPNLSTFWTGFSPTI